MNMRLMGWLIVLMFAALPGWAQVSDGSASGSPVLLSRQDLPGQHLLRRHGPRKNLGLAPNRLGENVQVYESSNWSGYAVVGSSFTQARGSWIVPAVDCAATPNGSASFWVGIDGWVDDTVEQTGTDSDCDGDKPSYYAWYEFAPKAGVTITSVPVSPGDHMSAEVNYNNEEFTVTMTNQTTGASYSTAMAFPPALRVSAEWIAELNGIRLSDFGTVRFGPDFTDVIGTNGATDATTSGTIGAFGPNVQASIIVGGKDQDEAVPSFLSTDGTSFTVTWWSR